MKTTTNAPTGNDLNADLDTLRAMMDDYLAELDAADDADREAAEFLGVARKSA